MDVRSMNESCCPPCCERYSCGRTRHSLRLLALWPKLDLERKKLAYLRTTASKIKCLNVNEDLLTALDRIDESKIAVQRDASEMASILEQILRMKTWHQI
jgi:hypothetical protein